MKKVYVCTPLAKEKFHLATIHAVLLKEKVFAFIPPVGQFELDKVKGAELDKLMIESCDEVWVFGRIGRDCAWEIGYAQGLGRPVKFYVNIENRDIIEDDWMVSLGNFEVVEL